MANFTTPEGYGTIAQRSRETAKRALAAAEKLGLDPSVVRTTSGGYVVPTAVLDEYEATLAADTEADEKAKADADEKAEAGAKAIEDAESKADAEPAAKTTTKRSTAKKEGE